MRLRILFVDYGDGGMPLAEVVTDEYAEAIWDALPERYLEQADFLREKYRGDSEVTIQEAFVTIPDDRVRALFAPPVIKGVVELVTP